MARPCYNVEQIREVEKDLLDRQRKPDELMIVASRAVATISAQILEKTWRPYTGSGSTILVLAGPGGNGGDALYAGALMAKNLQGAEVIGVLTDDRQRVHAPALKAFKEAGCRVWDPKFKAEDLMERFPFDLIIDGMLGIGGKGALRGRAKEWAKQVNIFAADPKHHAKVIAVDIPSGIDTDTGNAGEEPTTLSEIKKLGCGWKKPSPYEGDFISADYTISFGGPKRANAVNPHCGRVIVTQLHLDIDAYTPPQDDIWEMQFELRRRFDPVRQVHLLQINPWKPGDIGLRINEGEILEPSATANKYSGGVVAIHAGSPAYPGAAVLACGGAVHATSSMVRYVGPHSATVIARYPEVVVAPDFESCGSVQARVVGPGSFDADGRIPDFEKILLAPETVVIDADALTALAKDEQLRQLLQQREGRGVLTPHDGEFLRLLEGFGIDINPGADRIGAAQALAEATGCAVVVKGRVTLLAAPPPRKDSLWNTKPYVVGVDLGHSWLATPGSGDVFAGMLGAFVARRQWNGEPVDYLAATERVIAMHAIAGRLAAQTPFGQGPIAASEIIKHIQSAAALTSIQPVRRGLGMALEGITAVGLTPDGPEDETGIDSDGNLEEKLTPEQFQELKELIATDSLERLLAELGLSLRDLQEDE